MKEVNVGLKVEMRLGYSREIHDIFASLERYSVLLFIMEYNRFLLNCSKSRN